MPWHTDDDPWYYDVAEATVWALDPLYGEGGVFEPVTVVVDPDRTVVEEYIEPTVEYVVEEYIEPVIEQGQDLYEEGKEVAQEVAGYALLLGLAYLATR